MRRYIPKGGYASAHGVSRVEIYICTRLGEEYFSDDGVRDAIRKATAEVAEEQRVELVGVLVTSNGVHMEIEFPADVAVSKFMWHWRRKTTGAYRDTGKYKVPEHKSLWHGTYLLAPVGDGLPDEDMQSYESSIG